jgi:uncharacterized protein (DUF4415 family)
MARKRKVNPERLDADNPEWSARDFARARPATEVPPRALIRKVRGAQKAPTKERITVRLSRDVVSRFRESGEGWQHRVDKALREWLKRHSPEP